MATPITDLADVHGASSRTEQMVILQPTRTEKWNKADLAGKGQEFFKEVLYWVFHNQKLIHRASMSYDARYGSPESYTPCGGRLLFHYSEIKESDRASFKSRDCDKFFIECSNPRCNFEAGSPLDFDEFNSLLLNLMLKQMLPDWKKLFFINLNQFEFRNPNSPALSEECKRLGLISLAPKALYGDLIDWVGTPCEGYLGIGFLLAPQMDTLLGCDGLDEWLKTIILHKLEVEGVEIFRDIIVELKTSRDRILSKKR
jgi:hypothetical protein